MHDCRITAPGGLRPLPAGWLLNLQVECARLLSELEGAAVMTGKDCRAVIPHCDLCYTPYGANDPLCLACIPPYVADSREEVPEGSASCGGSGYSYYQAMDLGCDFKCPPEMRSTEEIDWNLGCSCWNSRCTRVVCQLDSPQDDEQNPDVQWECPVVAGRASCGGFPDVEAFLADPSPPLTDPLGADITAGQSYKDTDGSACVLASLKAIVDSWSPRCSSDGCTTAVQDLATDAVPAYTNYAAGGLQGELRVTNDSCYVCSVPSKDDVYRTPDGSGLLLPYGTQVDYVGHKLTTACEDFALVRLSLPSGMPVGTPTTGTAVAPPASYALVYMLDSCLSTDPELNKCLDSAAVASQGPFSCKTNTDCCSGRCNCPPSVAGASGTDAFQLQVLGAQLPSGAPLWQSVRPSDYGATLYRKVCCAAD